MTHYVLLKLAEGVDLEEAEKRIRETYLEMERTLPYMRNVRVFRNCVARKSNADIMVRADLEGEEYLQPYLTNPLHLAMSQDMASMVVDRTSFDRED